MSRAVALLGNSQRIPVLKGHIPYHQQRGTEIDGILHHFFIDLQLAGSGEVLSIDIVGSLRNFIDAGESDGLHAQLQIRLHKGFLSLINVLLSIKDIILEGFQIHLVIFRTSAGLMIGQNRSIVDADAVQHLRRHLVGCQIDILFFQTHIVPHHILRLEQIAVFQILRLQSHGRQMVSIHHQHHRLVIFRQRIHQFLDEIVHLFQLIHIIFPGVIVFLPVLRSAHGDLRIFQHRLRGIIPMALYGNRVNVIRPFRGVQTFDDLIRQDMILHPVCGRRIGNVRHVFFRSKGLESQIGENRFSGIEIGLVVVNGVGGVAQAFQDVGHAFAGFLLENTLIGILARPEIMQAHTGYGFKLRVGRAGSHGRHPEIARRILFHQPAEIGDGILRQIQKFHLFWIKEGFQLQENHIHRFLRYLGFLPGLGTEDNLLHQILAVAVGTVDAGVKKSGSQTVGKAVVLIGKGDVAKIAGQYTLLQGNIGDQQEGSCRRDHQRNIQPVIHLSLIFGRLDGQPDQAGDQKQKQDDDHDHHTHRQVLIQNPDGLRHQFQIRSGERRHPAGQNHAVDDAQHQPDGHDQNPGKNPSPGQVHQCGGHKNQEGIVQKYQLTSHHIADRLIQRMAADCFHYQIQQTYTQKLQRQ